MKAIFTAAWTTDKKVRYVPVDRSDVAELLRAHRRARKCRIARVADGYTITSGIVVLHLQRTHI